MEGFVFTLSNDERRILNNTHSRVSSHPTCWRREREMLKKQLMVGGRAVGLLIKY